MFICVWHKFNYSISYLTYQLSTSYGIAEEVTYFLNIFFAVLGAVVNCEELIHIKADVIVRFENVFDPSVSCYALQDKFSIFTFYW